MRNKNTWIYILLIIILCLYVFISIILKVFTNRSNISSLNIIFLETETANNVKKQDSDFNLNNNNQISKLNSIINNDLFILVNKDNTLEKDFIPDNLVYCSIEFLDYIETRYLNIDADTAAKMMFEAALEQGVVLLGASGFRSYETQEDLFYSRAEELGFEETSQYTAMPGASEHQVGLAIDIVGEDYQSLDVEFDQSDSFKWLINNCYKYGFILRYLPGKEQITGFCYEPWHFRYIGDSEIAEEIMSRNIVLEEYIEEVKKKIE